MGGLTQVDRPKVMANWTINVLLAYWKDHSKPCPMPVDYFVNLVMACERGILTRTETKEKIKLFFII